MLSEGLTPSLPAPADPVHIGGDGKLTPGYPTGAEREPEMLPAGDDYSEDETLRYLRDQYNIAKGRAKELTSTGGGHALKPKTRKAAFQLYSAV
jgi:hypothetical protein